MASSTHSGEDGELKRSLSSTFTNSDILLSMMCKMFIQSKNHHNAMPGPEIEPFILMEIPDSNRHEVGHYLREIGVNFTVALDLSHLDELTRSDGGRISVLDFGDSPVDDGILRSIRDEGIHSPLVVTGAEMDYRSSISMMREFECDFIPCQELSPERLGRSLTLLATLGAERREERPITLKERKEAAFQARERLRLQTILNTLPVGVYLANARGEIIEMNERARRIWGGQCKECKSLTEEFSRYRAWEPDSYKAIGMNDWPLMRSVRGGEILEGIPLDIQRLTGESGSILASSAPIIGDSDAPIGGVMVIQDVTQKREIERNLKKYSEELARSNAELEQFAYVASHDLREPLRMISSYLGLLERRYRGKLGNDADEFIKYAVDGSIQMQLIIDDLLAYSRVGTRGGEFKRVDLEDTLRQSLKNLRILIKENGAIITHDPLPCVWADQSQMILLFQNLLSNAVKFHRDEPPAVHISAIDHRDTWTFSFRDNGIGIPREYQGRIFQMFQRLHTKREYEGTGIGLAISKRIVERHGGRIWVESEGEGKGSTFFFTLPIRLEDRDDTL